MTSASGISPSLRAATRGVRVYVSSLAAATAAILAAATRLAVDSTDDEAEAAACHPAYIRRAFGLLFAGFDESSATTTSVKEV